MKTYFLLRIFRKSLRPKILHTRKRTTRASKDAITDERKGNDIVYKKGKKERSPKRIFFRAKTKSNNANIKTKTGKRIG